MNIIDFRYRPPYKSYRETIMYSDLKRAKQCSEAFGMHQSPAVAARDFAASLKEMDDAGIQTAVLAGRKVLPHIGVVDNRDIADLVRDHPGRFIGMAGADPSDMDAAMAEVETYVAGAGLRGVVLEPGLTKDPMFVEDRRIWPIYERCQALDVPVMLMVGSNCGPTVEFSKPAHAEAVAAAFPKLRVILSHGGWPWVTEMIHIAYRYKNVCLLPDLYFFNAPGCTDYLAAANYILKDQMLFGSAYPYVSLQEARDYFMNGRLRSEAVEPFFSGNARRVLGI
ncbi:MAG: amidohydrolase [Clostridia bacterium]|nr:amidohydrolase [Clostridia bacterium]